jgi:hypothetical protein
MDRDVVLVRRSNADGELNATLRNADDAGGNENIRVTGGTFKSGTFEEVEAVGQHIAFMKVSDVTISHVRFAGIFEAWNLYLVGCQDAILDGLVMNSGDNVKEDGIHINGCQRFAIINCIIRCGDDAFAIVQETAGLPRPPTAPCTDGLIANCYLHSRAANAIKVAIIAGTTTGIASVSRINFSNIVAKTGPGLGDTSAGITIDDLTNELAISYVSMDNVMLDASENHSYPLYIDSAQRIRLRGVVIREPYTRVEINRADHVELIDCVVDHPRNDVQCLLAAATDRTSNLRIVGGRYAHAPGEGQHAIQLGTSTNQVAGFEISNVLIGPAEGNGVFLQNALKGVIVGNRIGGCVYGIEEVGDSDQNVIIGNYLADNDVAMAITGAQTEAIRNVTNLSEAIPDTGGFREHFGGWSIASSAADDTPLTRLGATDVVSRVRAVRRGSVTGLTVMSTEECDTGSLTVTVYKNDSGIAGDAGDPMPFSVTLDSTYPSMRAVTQPKDTNACTFKPGDELYLVYESDDWTPSATIMAELETEQ